MPPKKKSSNTTPIDTVKHKDKRVNIPTDGKIAVKVINHYGDEALKVYELK